MHKKSICWLQFVKPVDWFVFLFLDTFRIIDNDNWLFIHQKKDRQTEISLTCRNYSVQHFYFCNWFQATVHHKITVGVMLISFLQNADVWSTRSVLKKRGGALCLATTLPTTTRQSWSSCTSALVWRSRVTNMTTFSGLVFWQSCPAERTV